MQPQMVLSLHDLVSIDLLEAISPGQGGCSLEAQVGQALPGENRRQNMLVSHVRQLRNPRTMAVQEREGKCHLLSADDADPTQVLSAGGALEGWGGFLLADVIAVEEHQHAVAEEICQVRDREDGIIDPGEGGIVQAEGLLEEVLHTGLEALSRTARQVAGGLEVRSQSAALLARNGIVKLHNTTGQLNIVHDLS